MFADWLQENDFPEEEKTQRWIADNVEKVTQEALRAYVDSLQLDLPEPLMKQDARGYSYLEFSFPDGASFDIMWQPPEVVAESPCIAVGYDSLDDNGWVEHKYNITNPQELEALHKWIHYVAVGLSEDVL